MSRGHLTPYLFRKTVTVCAVLIMAGGWRPLWAAEVDDAIRSAMVYTLEGNFAAAYREADHLATQYPRQAFADVVRLNILLTELSWDEQQEHLFSQVTAASERVFAVCKPRIKADKNDEVAYMQCGIGHFSLAYLYALEGRLFKAGSNGQKAINHLEQSLQINPAMIDARLYLGVAYYYAENLPPFIKALSRFLWFIPRGNASRSLPYIADVISNGTYYREAARFIYADLLAQREDSRAQAVARLKQLVADYPRGFRLQLALMTQLVLVEDYEAALNRHHQFLAEDITWSSQERALMDIWYARALLGCGDAAGAIAVMNDQDSAQTLPFWIDPWLALTRAQVFDLQHQRQLAKAHYENAMKLNQRYPSSLIRNVAEQGLRTPYQIPDSQADRASATEPATPRTDS